jgi:GH18 family chitinase
MEFIWHYTNNILEVLSNSVLLQVCDFLHGENTTLVWDNEQQVPFAYRKDQWVGFDDERSLKTKVFVYLFVYLFDVTSFSVTLIVK